MTVLHAGPLELLPHLGYYYARGQMVPPRSNFWPQHACHAGYYCLLQWSDTCATKIVRRLTVWNSRINLDGVAPRQLAQSGIVLEWSCLKSQHTPYSQGIFAAITILPLPLELLDSSHQQAYRYRTGDSTEDNGPYDHKIDFGATVFSSYRVVLRGKDPCALG